MELLLELLFGWWWLGSDGKTKTANVTQKYVLPVVIVVWMVLLTLLLVWILKAR